MAAKKIKKPVNKGVANVPVIMQLEMLECGAASLAMIMGYYEKWITLEQARVDCGVSRDGSSAKNILVAARSYGMETHAFRRNPEDLISKGQFPCIIHWGYNHFVVLDGFKGKKAVLNDPARGRVTVPWDEFDKMFTGIVLYITPGENFAPEGKKKSAIDYMKKQLRGTGPTVVFVMLTSTITALVGMISPIFSRIFIDRLLTGKNPDWLNMFTLALSLLAAVQILLSWITAIWNLRIEGKMSAMGNSSYLWKILKLPMHFFSQRQAGDLCVRQETNAEISEALINTFAPLAINTFMMIFYLVVMIRYNLALTLIGVISILLSIYVSKIISDKRVNITRVQLRDQGKLSGATVAGIGMIETIKSSGAENGFFGYWAGLQASVNNQKIRFAKLNQWLGMLPTLFSSVANLAVLGFGVLLVIRGDFTIGMVMAFQGFLQSFTSPASSLISAGQTMQEMVTKMERVEDVMSYPDDPWFTHKETTEERQKLTGNIHMENVTFGYSKLSAPLIENFSMDIKQGQKIAFVGRSGCGKSTLTKLLSGLYQPWSGEITFDGKNINEIDRDVFTGSVAVIDQEIILFGDTIAQNIAMWDPSLENFDLILAARDAGIHDDIMKRDGGYQHKLLEGGRDLSGGQRQRIEIARALAQDPTICILDEATSALDAKTENEVVKAITERGITCIVIAHRLSTIRDCDEIIVLDNGKPVERGTHDELMALNGLYTQLVTSE